MDIKVKFERTTQIIVLDISGAGQMENLAERKLYSPRIPCLIPTRAEVTMVDDRVMGITVSGPKVDEDGTVSSSAYSSVAWHVRDVGDAPAWVRTVMFQAEVGVKSWRM